MLRSSKLPGGQVGESIACLNPLLLLQKSETFAKKPVSAGGKRNNLDEDVNSLIIYGNEVLYESTD